MSVSGQGGARLLQGVHCPEKAWSKPGSTPIDPETQMCLSRLGPASCWQWWIMAASLSLALR